jgi:hypothetical protein
MASNPYSGSGIRNGPVFELTSNDAVGLRLCSWPGTSQKIGDKNGIFYSPGTDVMIFEIFPPTILRF